MYYYSENEAYDELREDFIDEFQDQLQERDRGEELKLIAEGTPFEAIMLKGGGELVCPSIPMELVYLNCYVAENNELDEAVTQILGIFDSRQRLEEKAGSSEEREIIDRIKQLKKDERLLDDIYEQTSLWKQVNQKATPAKKNSR